MKKISKYKVDNFILIPIIIFIFISIITIYSAQNLLDSSMQMLAFKQGLWYLLGFVFVYFIMFIGNKKIYKYAWLFYILGNISLFLVLFFCKPINDAKCWFSLPGIGTIQPSEL